MMLMFLLEYRGLRWELKLAKIILKGTLLVFILTVFIMFVVGIGYISIPFLVAWSWWFLVFTGLILAITAGIYFKND